VNDSIRRLAVAAVVLLAGLVVGTTYWQAWAVADLEERQDNAIQRVAQFSIDRGRIYAANGALLAGNRKRQADGKTYYFRRYPEGPLAAAAVGYSTQARSRTGLELSYNDYLTSSNANLDTLVDRTLDKLAGRTVRGNDLELTLRPQAQRVALEALGDNCGAAVALDPRTGRVLVLASAPSFDPNLIEKNFAKIESIQANCSPAAPLLNRATAGLLAPGSSFKILTAAAALDSGAVEPDSIFVDKGFCVEYGKPVYNFSDQSGPERFGRVTFSQALQHSINAVFCEVGKQMGAIRILEYAKRFGFYSLPPIETPANERRESGLYVRGKTFFPKNDFQVDPGRLAFGQERLVVTPLQMAMLTGAIANRGVLMRPYLVSRVVGPNGGAIRRTEPDELGRPIRPATAAALTEMMESVVTGGTGGNAAIPGIRVAGKTGTAETAVSSRNSTWFVAFAPVERPTVAVAVALENQTGTGGSTAAPIARAIIESLLAPESSS
jgi:peptidoglycan glycosyltransferase